MIVYKWRCQRGSEIHLVTKLTDRNGVGSMNIGEIIRNDDGIVSGYIAEADFDFANVFFQKVESSHPRAPLFNLMTRSPRGRQVRLGSIWERATKETGEVYFGGYIDSARSGYVPIRLFRSRQDARVWNVVRATSQRRREAEDIDLPEQDGADSALAHHPDELN